MAGRNALEIQWQPLSPAKRRHICDDARVSLSGGRTRGLGDQGRGEMSWVSLTFKRREATVEDQLEITKLALGQDKSSERLGLSRELIVTRGIAGEQVLEDATVGGIRHFDLDMRLEMQICIICCRGRRVAGPAREWRMRLSAGSKSTAKHDSEKKRMREAENREEDGEGGGGRREGPSLIGNREQEGGESCLWSLLGRIPRDFM